MDILERFPRVWCDTCQKIQPMAFEVMKAGSGNDHDAADIICGECRSVIATLHGRASVRRIGARNKTATKASEMAGQAIDGD